MAIVSTLAIAANLTPQLDVGAYPINKDFAVSATEAVNGDVIELLTFGRGTTIFTACLTLSATLGASSTAQLVVGDGTTNRAVTDASTAGGASVDTNNAQGAIDVVAGEKLYALVGGADISAAATMGVRLLCAH